MILWVLLGYDYPNFLWCQTRMGGLLQKHPRPGSDFENAFPSTGYPRRKSYGFEPAMRSTWLQNLDS